LSATACINIAWLRECFFNAFQRISQHLRERLRNARSVRETAQCSADHNFPPDRHRRSITCIDERFFVSRILRLRVSILYFIISEVPDPPPRRYVSPSNDKFRWDVSRRDIRSGTLNCCFPFRTRRTRIRIAFTCCRLH